MKHARSALSKDIKDWQPRTLELPEMEGALSHALFEIQFGLEQLRGLVGQYATDFLVWEKVRASLLTLLFHAAFVRDESKYAEGLLGLFCGDPERFIKYTVGRKARSRTFTVWFAQNVEKQYAEVKSLSYVCLTRPEWWVVPDDTRLSKQDYLQSLIDKKYARCVRRANMIVTRLRELEGVESTSMP